MHAYPHVTLIQQHQYITFENLSSLLSILVEYTITLIETTIEQFRFADVIETLLFNPTTESQTSAYKSQAIA